MGVLHFRIGFIDKLDILRLFCALREIDSCSAPLLESSREDLKPMVWLTTSLYKKKDMAEFSFTHVRNGLVCLFSRLDSCSAPYLLSGKTI